MKLEKACLDFISPFSPFFPFFFFIFIVDKEEKKKKKTGWDDGLKKKNERARQKEKVN